MPNTSRKTNLNQNINPYLNKLANWRSNRGNVHLLMKKLKKSEKKENKEKLIKVQFCGYVRDTDKNITKSRENVYFKKIVYYLPNLRGQGVKSVSSPPHLGGQGRGDYPPPIGWKRQNR